MIILSGSLDFSDCNNVLIFPLLTFLLSLMDVSLAQYVVGSDKKLGTLGIIFRQFSCLIQFISTE